MRSRCIHAVMSKKPRQPRNKRSNFRCWNGLHRAQRSGNLSGLAHEIHRVLGGSRPTAQAIVECRRISRLTRRTNPIYGVPREGPLLNAQNCRTNQTENLIRSGLLGHQGGCSCLSRDIVSQPNGRRYSSSARRSQPGRPLGRHKTRTSPQCK